MNSVLIHVPIYKILPLKKDFILDPFIVNTFIGKIMKNYSNSDTVKIAIEYGCKTVKDFAEFMKSYNAGLRVI